MPLLTINHHYFRESRPTRSIFPCTAKNLLKSLQTLNRSGWRIGGQEDILKFIHGDLSRSDYVAIITFDDGLKEQLDALTILQKRGCSGIFFMPTFPITEKKVLEVHKLHLIRNILRDEEIEKDMKKHFYFATYKFSKRKLENQYRYDTAKAQRIKFFINFALKDNERRYWINEKFCRLFGPEEEISRRLYFSKAELIFLAKGGQLGSHCHSHVPLAQQSAKYKQNELAGAKKILENETGFPIIGVSYPYGGSEAVNPAVYHEAAKAGYLYGFSMVRGIVWQNNPFVKYGLRRIDFKDLEKTLLSKKW